MKLYFLFLVLFLSTCASLSLAQTDFDYTKCSQRLLDALDRQNSDFIKIRIMLTDQVDIRSLDQALYQRNASLSERASEVILQLQSKAENTRSSVVDYLSQLNGFQSENTKELWIVNGLITTLPHESVKLATLHQDILYLDLDVQPLFDDFEKVKPGPEYEKSVNGIEPGLEAVNATGMWELGYTGYGHWALIFDTGTDGFHPSLVYNFQGLYTPVEQSWFTDNGADYPFDCGGNGHGTHVAGTTLGLDRLTNDTIGVAFNGNWLSSPAISCDETVFSNLEGLQWALNPDGDAGTTADMPTVINNSWRDPGADDCDPMYEMGLTSLEAAGIAVVFSAGNSGPDVSTITDPKNLNTDLVNSFAVGSVNGNTATLPISPSSSRGPSVCGQTGSLLIKPEVSAPGVSVRSSLPGGNFDFYSGTSMASPHVSGAVLLLKEAFPGLTGTELKLALYHSAVDLGVAGEDNTFGMGIIDVVAAYDYLVNEGYTPFDPSVSTDALVVALPGLEGVACGEMLSPEIIIENSGQQIITSLDIDYWYDSGSPDQMNWTGIIDPGSRVSVFLPGVVIPSGDHELRVEIVGVNGSPDERFYNNRGIKLIQWLQDIPAAVVSSDPVCNGSQAFVYVDQAPEGVVEWYSTQEAISPSSTGPSYVSPVLTSDTTVFFDIRKVGNLGPVDFSIGPTQTTSDLDRYLLFDAFQLFVLKSVKVFANSAGGRLVELRNAQGLTIASKPFGLTPGEHILDLDFKIPAGLDYQLGISFTSDLTYNFSDAQFPYEIEDIVSIKGTNNGLNSNTYYYFYDWDIEYGFPCGGKPVELTVADGNVQANFTPSAFFINIAYNEFITFENNSTGATDYFWDFGDGNTSTEVSPAHLFDNVGDYQVILVATDPDGCSSVFSIAFKAYISVSTADPEEVSSKMIIYPNPSGGLYTIVFNFEGNPGGQLDVIDALGRIVETSVLPSRPGQTYTIDLHAFPQGVYLLRYSAGNQLFFNKLYKI